MHAALARAWSLHQAGEHAAAARAYEAILAAEPTQADTLNCYGILLMQSGRAAEALALFRRAVAGDASQAAFHLNVARAAMRLGQPELALDAADAALARAPSANARLLRGVALRDLDRAMEARDAFRDGSQQHPEDVALSFNLAVAELEAGSPEASIAQFENLLRARPNEARAWVGLGNARAAQGALPAAEQAYRQALTLAPNLPDAWRLLGLAAIQRGEPHAAIEALQRALQRDARDQAALAALGVAAVRAGDPIARTLLDFETIVHTAAMCVPDLDIDALGEELLAHPSLRYDRSQKTTRDGGQTGNLADAATPQLQRFVTALHAEIVLRIASAETRFASTRHPLANTAPARWQLNLWATVLRTQGHQAAHLHPSGWMSGVYYVALPDVDDANESGWIEFGIPPAELAPEAGLPRHRVQPRVGELTTFPSYLYHRTVPHAGSAPRISLAFDVVPLA